MSQLCSVDTALVLVCSGILLGLAEKLFPAFVHHRHTPAQEIKCPAPVYVKDSTLDHKYLSTWHQVCLHEQDSLCHWHLDFEPWF